VRPASVVQVSEGVDRFTRRSISGHGLRDFRQVNLSPAHTHTHTHTLSEQVNHSPTHPADICRFVGTTRLFVQAKGNHTPNTPTILHLHDSVLGDTLIQCNLHEQLGLSVLFKGTSTDFSPSRLRDSNQRPFGYWPNALGFLRPKFHKSTDNANISFVKKIKVHI
jgi:hypothetical protein